RRGRPERSLGHLPARLLRQRTSRTPADHRRAGLMTDYADLLTLASSVATEAAALVRDRRADGVSVANTKTSPTDVVTAIDHESEDLILRGLLGARPDDGFVGEEGAGRPSRSGVSWIVDPLDGTVNFL